MIATFEMSVFNLGLNGVFLSNPPPNFSFSLHNSLISRPPNSLINTNCIPVRKSWNLVRRKPKLFISAMPVFGIGLDYTGMGKSWNFVGKTTKFGIVSASGNGEAEVQSSSVQLVEKDLQFNPTFQDYLKVMESVRTERSKKPNGNADVVAPQKRSAEKRASVRPWEKPNARGGKLSYRDKEKDSTSRKRGDVGGRGSGWGLVERILEKKTSGNGNDNLKDEKNSLNKQFNGIRESVDKEHPEKERMGSTKWKERNSRDDIKADESRIRGQSNDPLKHRNSDRFSKTEKVGNISAQVYVKKINHLSNGGQTIGGNRMKQGESESKAERKMVDYENSKNFMDRKTLFRSNPERKLDESLVTRTPYQGNNFNPTTTSNKSFESESTRSGRRAGPFLRMEQRKTNGNLNGNETDILEEKLNITGISKRYVRSHDNIRQVEKPGSTAQFDKSKSTQFDKFGEEVVNDDDIEDRAAFKTFEVFTDVRNRPRVLQMEMEERIHKLAKRLNATDVDMPEWQFSKMIHGAKIKFSEHSILRIVQILGALGNWKRVLQVVQWLQSRERFKAYKSRYIYTTVLDVLGKAKRPTEALNIFYAMRQELSSYPDLAAYHCIAVTLGQAGLMKDLFVVIDCMRSPPEKKFKLGLLQKWDPRLEPDLVIYNAVLNACVQQKQWEGAFWVLQQLKQQNIRPTNTTYGLVMEVMLVCGKYNLVHEFFRKVEKTAIPSALNYKVLVNTLWKEGKTDEAVLAVKDMERRGVVGSASLYYDLARCLCSAGRCKEALLQVDKICKVAKKPLAVTYTGLIQACLDSGSIENGTYIFNEMHKFCSPNTVTCNIMLKSYIRHEMFEEAKDLFQKILDGSHQIKSKHDQDQKAMPDKFTFNTMMDACAAENKWDDFEYTYKQMLHHGFHFDTRRHLRLVLDAFRAGKWQIIDTTWDHLIRFGRTPPPPIIQERFCIKLQENDHLSAISCVDAHRGSEMHAFSEKAWLYLLQKNSHRFKNDTIFRLMHKLNHITDESDGPCHVYQNLLNACRKLTEASNNASTRKRY